MSKFRKKKTKLTVNGKLPFLTLFPTLANVDCITYDLQTDTSKQIQRFAKAVSNIEDEGARVFVSIVNSNDSRCEIVENHTGLGLVVSTKALVEVARTILKSDTSNASQYGRTQRQFDNSMNSVKVLKLIDIVRGLREMSVPVVECEIKYCEDKWKYYFARRGYSSSECQIDSTLTNGCQPFISKRYEKHSFYALCKSAFSAIRDETDRLLWARTLAKWEYDLDLFKREQMPKALVEQEVFLMEKELSQ